VGVTIRESGGGVSSRQSLSEVRSSRALQQFYSFFFLKKNKGIFKNKGIKEIKAKKKKFLKKRHF